MNSDPLRYLVLRQSDDPEAVAAAAEHLGRNSQVEAFVQVAPRVAPPAKWAKRVQNGPVAVAAWAARYCDDPDTLWAIFNARSPRRGVVAGLCSNPAMPDDLRVAIVTAYPGDTGLLSKLYLGLDTDRQIAAFVGKVVRGGSVLTRELDRKVRTGDWGSGLTDAQAAALIGAYVEREDWERLMGVGGAGASAATKRLLLDTVFAMFDWGYLSASPVAQDPQRASELGLVALADPERAVPPALAAGLLWSGLLEDDREFAKVASSYLNASRVSTMLEQCTTRERLAIVLDVSPRGNGFMLPDSLAALFSDRDPGSDALLERLWAASAIKALEIVVAGKWAPTAQTCEVAAHNQIVAPAVLPTPDQIDVLVRRIVGEQDLHELVLVCYHAIHNGAMPDTYRDVLLDRVPGLAHRVATGDGDHAPGTPFAQADEWIWFRLSEATSRVDLAIDQLGAASERSLDDVCAALSRLDRVGAK